MLHLLATALTDANSAGPSLAWTIVAFGLGLVLWGSGGGIMRPAVGALGLAAGAIAGRMVWLESGVGPEWVLPMVGALATSCVALLAWHLASGMLLSLLAAMLTGSVVWGIASMADSDSVPPPPVAGLFGLQHPTYATTPDASETAQANDAATPPAANPGPDSATPDDTPTEAARATDTPLTADLRAQAEAGWDHIAASPELAPIRTAWSRVPDNDRFTILVASGIAALLGLLAAALAGRTAAIWLTASGGGLLVMCALPRLVSTMGASNLGFEPQTAAMVVTFGWLTLTILGIVIQMVLRTPPSAPAAE